MTTVTGYTAAKIDQLIAGVSVGSGVELVSGVVDLDGTGSPVREFYCTTTTTIEGVVFAAGTVVVFRRTLAGVWGYIVVDQWTNVGAFTTTTTTTTAATTTTTTTAAPSEPGVLTFRTEAHATGDGTDFDVPGVDIGPAAPGRHLVVMLTWWAGGARNGNLTVNDVAATAVHGGPGTGSPGNSATNGYQVYVIPHPTGTTVDLATTSSTWQPSIAVWTTNKTPTFIAGAHTDAAVSAGSATVTATSVDGGFAVTGFRSRSSAFSTAWTDATKRWEKTTSQPGSGADTPTPTASTSVTATFTPANSQITRVGLTTFRWED